MMIPNYSMMLAVLCMAILGSLPRLVRAQTDTLPQQGLRQMEASVGEHRLSNGYANWRDAFFRGQYQQGENLWAMELLHADRFDERGIYVGLQDRFRIAPQWNLSLGYGKGDGVTWLPSDRIDAFAHHTWGEQLNWVTHLGVGYYKAPDDHRDRWGSIGMSAYLAPYFNGPWVAQGEMRWSQSNPGSISTRQYFLALSWGHHGQTQIIGRHGWGREGWLSLGDARSIVDFASRQDTLTLLHWVSPGWGIKLVADNYRNDQYRRRGLNLGLFREWP
jgi:YaiO family outer membrane protein